MGAALQRYRERRYTKFMPQPLTSRPADWCQIKLGTHVKVRRTGRLGKVVQNDGGEVCPYKVAFDDDLLPKEQWFSPVEIEPETGESETVVPVGKMDMDVTLGRNLDRRTSAPPTASVFPAHMHKVDVSDSPGGHRDDSDTPVGRAKTPSSQGDEKPPLVSVDLTGGQTSLNRKTIQKVPVDSAMPANRNRLSSLAPPAETRPFHQRPPAETRLSTPAPPAETRPLPHKPPAETRMSTHMPPSQTRLAQSPGAGPPISTQRASCASVASVNFHDLTEDRPRTDTLESNASSEFVFDDLTSVSH
mmetsp:Transcript_2142/g.5271  ORF Transcript_2142/g.5271 Transcript_2142/m.5271 type:complete len:303 (-) Transcript_2142:135-1043(-)|eukprot:CAMPEP_0117524834 /NCGR_PEP_ID=MMETSP0784-20121206/35455_1 /TAXON_ID=39447 /ORGANISM="" /LENGTH=302 /DNA_ID=CAMNT_0005321005 /DNA_START=89 /DNA_END=997 /DNA_ORIENTATION=-